MRGIEQDEVELAAVERVDGLLSESLDVGQVVEIELEKLHVVLGVLGQRVELRAALGRIADAEDEAVRALGEQLLDELEPDAAGRA